MRKNIVIAGALLAFAALTSAPAVRAEVPQHIQQALANPARTDADRERDVRDKAGEVLAFAGVKPGMTVADIFGASGYYSELLAYAVGDRGKVLLINNVPYAQFAAKETKERFTEGRLPTIERRLVEASYMNMPPASVDLAIIVMSYHDIYWLDEKQGWPEISADGFFDSLKKMLKPGAKLLIVDHNAAAGTGKELAGKLHRLNEEWAKKDLAAHGFVLEKTFDGLRNKDDQLDKMVYDPAVKGKTDRYVHLYRKK